MTAETFYWIVSISMVPLVVVVARVYMMLSELLQMHRFPDKTGFGTTGLEEVIKHNTDTFRRYANAFDALVDRMEWLTKQLGVPQPPPKITLEEDRNEP